jgi:hypothetical protein
VTIADAAVDGDGTVVFCDLLTDGVGVCPARGLPPYGGALRDRSARGRVSAAPAVRVPRYRCTTSDCGREVFAHNTDPLARPGCTCRCARYVLRGLMIDHMTVSAVARELGLSGSSTLTGQST